MRYSSLIPLIGQILSVRCTGRSRNPNRHLGESRNDRTPKKDGTPDRVGAPCPSNRDAGSCRHAPADVKASLEF